MDNENSIEKKVQVFAAEAPEESETADACLVMKDELESKAQRVVDDQETAGKDLKKVQTSAAVSESMKDELESKAQRVVDDQETAGEDLKKVQTSAAVSEAMKQKLTDKADCICDKSQDTDDSEVQVVPPADKGAQSS